MMQSERHCGNLYPFRASQTASTLALWLELLALWAACSVQVGGTAEGEALGRGGTEGPWLLGGSRLEEMLVHVSAEGSTGSQCPAHKFLSHMPGEGAPCF